MPGKLYLVATPIGNLEDITLRAIRILKEVDFIAAEDTRQSLKLLNHFEISKPLISYHRHNEEIKTNLLMDKLMENMNIALITDAGTPIISDPGDRIVCECIKRKIPVIPIPGACALISALIASGINAKEFLFMGFLPLNKKNRKEKFDEIRKSKNTIILYEAPHKLKNTISELSEWIGERNIVLAKELTKIHESYVRGSAKEILELLENPKGEYVIIIEGNKAEKENIKNLSAEELYNIYKEQGLEKKEIIKKISKELNKNKNEIYMKFIKRP